MLSAAGGGGDRRAQRCGGLFLMAADTVPDTLVLQFTGMAAKSPAMFMETVLLD